MVRQLSWSLHPATMPSRTQLQQIDIFSLSWVSPSRAQISSIALVTRHTIVVSLLVPIVLAVRLRRATRDGSDGGTCPYIPAVVAGTSTASSSSATSAATDDGAHCSTSRCAYCGATNDAPRIASRSFRSGCAVGCGLGKGRQHQAERHGSGHCHDPKGSTRSSLPHQRPPHVLAASARKRSRSLPNDPPIENTTPFPWRSCAAKKRNLIWVKLASACCLWGGASGRNDLVFAISQLPTGFGPTSAGHSRAPQGPESVNGHSLIRAGLANPR